MKTQEIILEALQQAMQDAHIEILDPRDDDCHLEAIVVSKEFEGLSLVRQHQIVMNALKDHFDGGGLHALALKTYTPEDWNAKTN